MNTTCSKEISSLLAERQEATAAKVRLSHSEHTVNTSRMKHILNVHAECSEAGPTAADTAVYAAHILLNLHAASIPLDIHAASMASSLLGEKVVAHKPFITAIVGEEL